ncbi:MAG TPA: NADH-quinone oxidoreductase subunit C [candidate division Zixibacteria bacterium]|nr:NADH-quinone oxidoreductase subunit C [candidate division Zixibacteria bacterium]
MTSVEQEILAVLANGLGEKVLQTSPLQPEKLSVRVNLGIHREALKILLDRDETAGISAITGVDLGENIEVMYHVRTHGTIVTIRTQVPEKDPKIETITDMLPGANFHEREVADLFGLTFEGNPDQERLILSEKWPKNVFPLRKDAEFASAESRSREISTSDEGGVSSDEGSLTTVIIGPQHPALIEPEKFSLEVDGEIVKDVKPRIGYVHRGVEKAAESRTYLQDIYLTERICGICNCCHATCFCQAVEAIMGTDIPARARYLRTIVLELNRLQSHMLLLGHAGYEAGYEPLFQYMWRDREIVMDTMEMLTGNRVIASFVTIGGVRRDLKEERTLKIKAGLATLKKRMVFYKDLLESDPTLKMRTKGVGVLKRQDALKLCVVGPVARGSGVKMDVRKDEPYAAYDKIPFNMVSYSEGDSWTRLMVRVDEISESIDILNFALDNLSNGPYRVRVPRVVPAGEGLSRVEAPRGELFYYVKSNGSARPERVKMRTPTFANILSFVHIAKNANIADVPVSFVSLDPCFSCTDR